MPDIVNFTLLSAGYYYIPLSILEHCSGVQSSYMEIIWSFCVLLLWFLLRRSWTVVSLVLIMPYCWGKTFMSTLLNSPWIMCFFHLFDGNRHYCHPFVSTCTVPSDPFQDTPSLPKPGVVSFCACADHYLAENTGLPLHCLGVLPFVQLSSLVLSSGTQ